MNSPRDKVAVMVKLYSVLFMVFGSLFVSLGAFLWEFISIPVKGGMVFSFILAVFDRIWFVAVGFYLVFAGIYIYRQRNHSLEHIRIAGFLFIYSIISIFFSIVFSVVTKPVIDSSWRVFTFSIQVLSRFFNPSLSADFLIPFVWLISMIIGIYCFQKFCNLKLREL